MGAKSEPLARQFEKVHHADEHVGSIRAAIGR